MQRFKLWVDAVLLPSHIVSNFSSLSAYFFIVKLTDRNKKINYYDGPFTETRAGQCPPLCQLLLVDTSEIVALWLHGGLPISSNLHNTFAKVYGTAKYMIP